jgi:hypothetical protein
MNSDISSKIGGGGERVSAFYGVIHNTGPERSVVPTEKLEAGATRNGPTVMARAEARQTGSANTGRALGPVARASARPAS